MIKLIGFIKRNNKTKAVIIKLFGKYIIINFKGVNNEIRT